MSLFTIEKLIHHRELPGLELAAGKKASEKEILNVNIIDNPDTYDWLSAGDFLLTTGYIFKDDPAMQQKLIKELSEINCAGLGIKVKRYLDHIPGVMIRTANNRNFPIVQIPYDYTLAYVSNVINNEIFKREDSLLKKSIKIHSILTNCALNGGSLDEIASQVSSLIGNPLIIVDSKWRLLAYAEHPGNQRLLKDYLNLNKKEKPFSAKLTDSIPNEFQSFHKAIKRNYPEENGDIVCRVLPIAVNKVIYGYLIAWETVSQMQYIDYMALESAATTISLERVKARQIEEIRHNLRQDFFDDLLQGKIESVNAINSMAEIHNMDAKKSYVCLVIKRRESSGTKIQELIDSKEKLSIQKNRMIQTIQDVASLSKRNMTSIHRGNLVISFLMLKTSEIEKKVSPLLGEGIDSIYQKIISELPEISISLGVSKPCIELLDMDKAYMQAMEAIKISEGIKNKKPISFFEDLAVYHLFDTGTSNQALTDFYEAGPLARLVKYDDENNTNLVQTLEQYFSCNGNVSSASKAMYLHRNTFIYRIEKIKAVLEDDLTDPERLFEIQVALHIRKVLNNYKI